MAKLLSLANFLRPREKLPGYKRAHFFNQLGAEKQQEILLFSEGDHMPSAWPTLTAKRVLYFNDQRHKYVLKKLLQQDAGEILNYVYAGESVSEQRRGCYTVMGDSETLGIKRGHFDVVICPFAIEAPDRIAKTLIAAARCMDNGCRLVLSVRHPQVDNMLCNQNPASAQASEESVARHFAWLKANQLYVEDVREGPVDLALKAFFGDLENDYYHDYKNTPMTLHFRAVKFVRKKG